MIPTADPDVFIEEQREGYIRYRRTDGAVWEVRGICDGRGDCYAGAAEPAPVGLDVPVGPAPFDGCCPLEITLLVDWDASQ